MRRIGRMNHAASPRANSAPAWLTVAAATWSLMLAGPACSEAASKPAAATKAGIAPATPSRYEVVIQEKVAAAKAEYERQNGAATAAKASVVIQAGEDGAFGTEDDVPLIRAASTETEEVRLPPAARAMPVEITCSECRHTWQVSLEEWQTLARKAVADGTRIMCPRCKSSGGWKPPAAEMKAKDDPPLSDGNKIELQKRIDAEVAQYILRNPGLTRRDVFILLTPGDDGLLGTDDDIPHAQSISSARGSDKGNEVRVRSP